MNVGSHINRLGMAALAAVLILMPGMALAEVCDKASLVAEISPRLADWIAASPLKQQLELLLSPANWITAALMIWILASSGARSTIVGAGWFALLACSHGVSYLLIDINDPYTKAAIAEGCVENSPYRALVNLAFMAGAVLLSIQRIRQREKTSRSA